MKQHMRKIHKWFWERISNHILLSSIISGLVITPIIFMLPFRRIEVIPHIITYASCNLALIGFVFSILFGVKGAVIYSRIECMFPCAIENFYRLVFRTTVASAVTVFISIFIIAIPNWSEYLRIIPAFVGVCVFIYMVVGTFFTLDFLITLMVKDIKRTPKNDGNDGIV